MVNLIILIMRKTRVIAISNHKGGVGKTTSTANIGVALSLKNKKVLLIDLDPQANLSQNFGFMNRVQNIYTAMKGNNPLDRLMVYHSVDIVPSTLDLSGAEIELAGEAGNQFILKELIDQIKDQYDYVLIDCPPSLGLLTINAFTAADEIIIPLQAEFFATQGLAKMIDVIEKVKKRLNKDLEVGGVLITQYDSRKTLNREVAETAETFFKDKVFKTKIRNNIALAEAPAFTVDIFKHSPKSNGAEDYMAVTEEILKR